MTVRELIIKLLDYKLDTPVHIETEELTVYGIQEIKEIVQSNDEFIPGIILK